ncbi:phosphoadenosine phosphosulfate reductase [Bacteroidia bacterium]|nr:phosphoadenosine phosphosulfate reductase [Bacteroidia bacterium]
MSRIYKQKNVLAAARERVSYIFDEFPNISVSVSGGKDSSVIFHLFWQEAQKRKRTFDVAFIDQEAEYQNTIKVIRSLRGLPYVHLKWYQIPFLMTNSASYAQDYLTCWDGNNIREFEPDSIRTIGINTEKLTWEKLLPLLEKQQPDNTAQILGLRSNESLNRYRAVTLHPGYNNVAWSSKTAAKTVFNFYPIYDWGFDDVWRFIFDENISYNRIYDYQFAKDYNKNDMRVSCLIHEKSYHDLVDLPEFEPDTFEWLCQRCKGIDTAMRYAKEKQMYSNEKLPTHYKTWHEFRDFLLENHPNKTQKARFEKRFENHPKNESVYRQQVGQLLINDWENITDVTKDQEEKRELVKQKYFDVL